MFEIYVYLDWTEEEVPRPFYAGIGTKARFECLKRNAVHSAIKKRCGFRRELVAIVETYEEASALEKHLIAKHELNVCRYKKFGANMTDGGEGASGYLFSDEQKERCSLRTKEAMKKPEVRAKLDKIYASDEWRKNMRNGVKSAMTDEIKAFISQQTKIAMAQPEVKQKMLDGQAKPETKAKRIARWEKYHATKLPKLILKSKINKIRFKKAKIKLTKEELAQSYKDRAAKIKASGVLKSKMTDEKKKEIAQKSFELWQNDEYRQKQMQIRNSEEYRKKLSAANRRTMENSEVIEKIRKGNLGKKRSEETKQKLREARARLKADPERYKRFLEKKRQTELKRKGADEGSLSLSE